MFETDNTKAARFRRELLDLIPQVRALACMLTRDATAADDLAQDALVRAWQARDRFTVGTNLKAWLYAIVRNQHLSLRRRSWRATPLDMGEAERNLVAPDDPSAPLELNELRMALSVLPGEQREALILVGAADLSYEEAAEICGCPVGTVKSRVSRARNTLKGALESGGYERDDRPAGESSDVIMAEALRPRA